MELCRGVDQPKQLGAFAHDELGLLALDDIFGPLDLLAVDCSSYLCLQVLDRELGAAGEVVGVALGNVVNGDGQVLARDGVVGDGKLAGCRSQRRAEAESRTSRTFCGSSSKEVRLAGPQPEATTWEHVSGAGTDGRSGQRVPSKASSFSRSHIAWATRRGGAH